MKLLIGIEADRRWSMYATHEKDLLFKKLKWIEINDYIVVVHDNTNVGMPTVSNLDQKWPLYRKYFAECLADSSTYIQLFGWIHGSNMFTGHSSDEKYTELTRILESQQKFQEYD